MKVWMVIAFVFLSIVLLSGCASTLEGDMRVESTHKTAMSDRQPEEEVVISTYDELKALIVELVKQHETNRLVIAYRYDGDVQEDVDRAINETMSSEPIAVFAVADITATVTRIVSLFEIDFRIEYKRNAEQVASIVSVSTLRSLRSELLNIMSEYREEALFQISLQVDEDDMADLIRETYYQNPRSVVIMPVFVLEIHATDNGERLIELRFNNIEQPSVLLQYLHSLTGSVRMNALAAEGDSDATILLSLAENLMDACDFDEGTARTISEHGVQNLAATAYSALVRGSAVGEGFSMAFKALCDELGFECQVVLGYLNNMVHAWNIVSLNGDYYHVDLAMCALNGIDTAFLKNDGDFAQSYTWDFANTVECNGEMSFDDIAEFSRYSITVEDSGDN